MANENAKAFESSEIFTNYFKTVKASEKAKINSDDDIDNKLAALEALDKIEAFVNSSPSHLKEFRKVQQKILVDDSFKNTLEPKFANVIMKMNLTASEHEMYDQVSLLANEFKQILKDAIDGGRIDGSKDSVMSLLDAFIDNRNASYYASPLRKYFIGTLFESSIHKFRDTEVE